MRLVSAALRYVDQSLYGRYVRQQAREMRVSEQEARNQQAETAEMMLGALGKGPGLDAVRQAVGRFLRGEAREVEITLRPAEPVAFSEFGPGRRTRRCWALGLAPRRGGSAAFAPGSLCARSVPASVERR